ncbi:DinB family protein [Pedobacter sp.]|uniref:DinB family protein n=1 Tax=Pedobacter sp. TaxID=1411316 RepID=UPI0031E3AE01
MKAIEKKAFITDLYQRTEAILNLAIEQYQNLDEKALTFAVDEQSWNIAQCLAHLNTYGHYYLPKMKAVLAKPNEMSLAAYVPSWLGTYFIGLMDIKNGNKKYKAAKQHQPKVADVYAEVTEFINQQETFLKYIRAFERVDVNKIKIPISINKLVKLRLGDVLAFMVMHNERHIHQIRNIQRAHNNALTERTVFAALAP